MNFLLRTAQPAVRDQPKVHGLPIDTDSMQSEASTLAGLIAEDPFPSSEDGNVDSSRVRGGNSDVTGPSEKNQVPVIENHSDVTEDEGWIIIPYKELPDNWSDAPDICSFRSLDRSIIFPGELVYILICLSAPKQDTDIITPFKVAAMLSKNGILGQNTKQKNENLGTESNFVTGGEPTTMHQGASSQNIEQNGGTLLNIGKIDTGVDISTSESLLRLEDHKKQTEAQLARFKNSHFFVRIAEANEPLWSKKSGQEPSSPSSVLAGENFKENDSGSRKTSRKVTHLNAIFDRGNFDASISGGVARNTVQCHSLSNGDIVVLLQVNVGIDFLKNPVLEVLQFEKYQDGSSASENPGKLVCENQDDPCRELLKWLLPLDHIPPHPSRPLSPPSLISSSGTGSMSHKSSFSTSSGSQLFSFGHFRSYSVPSLPQSTAPSPPVTTSNSKLIFDFESWDHLSPQKSLKSQEVGSEGLLSFRGMLLQPERFSVHCGLRGIHIPGRKWRRKLQIIQPVEIYSFASDCNTEDLLCVQIKNVSPAHTPDIVIFLDAITVVFEEASEGGGPPQSLPIACIEAGNGYSLPNLSLRRGEEHSFILKPRTLDWRNPKANVESSQSSHLLARGVNPNMHLPSNIEERRLSSSADQYVILVSCRCNYTESRLFFKQPTSWRPRVTRDLMISVASEMSEQTFGPSGRVSNLPVQVLTLQASNLTSEDLTLTVRAPASFTSSPTVVSFNSAPSMPMSPFVHFSEFAGRVSRERCSTGMQRLSSLPLVSENQEEKAGGGIRSVSLDKKNIPTNAVIPNTGWGCTQLLLQSAVPLGCVPCQSMATVKLELLPLIDGIITLDTLQIDVKEKGLTYIPEHPLKINATSSISTVIA